MWNGLALEIGFCLVCSLAAHEHFGVTRLFVAKIDLDDSLCDVILRIFFKYSILIYIIIILFTDQLVIRVSTNIK